MRTFTSAHTGIVSGALTVDAGTSLLPPGTPNVPASVRFSGGCYALSRMSVRRSSPIRRSAHSTNLFSGGTSGSRVKREKRRQSSKIIGGTRMWKPHSPIIRAQIGLDISRCGRAHQLSQDQPQQIRAGVDHHAQPDKPWTSGASLTEFIGSRQKPVVGTPELCRGFGETSSLSRPSLWSATLCAWPSASEFFVTPSACAQLRAAADR